MNYIQILEKLISIDTTTTKDTLELVTWIHDYFQKRGVPSFLVYNPEKTRANLVATIGDPNQPGVILSGHMDVVPADSAEWKTPPFELVCITESGHREKIAHLSACLSEHPGNRAVAHTAASAISGSQAQMEGDPAHRNGAYHNVREHPSTGSDRAVALENSKLYGRGTTDMKGALAIALSLVPEFIKSGKTIHFALTHDEEFASQGIKQLLSDDRVSPILQKAIGCIVMEPTLSQIVIGQKSAMGGAINIYGKPAHSSNPALGLNAFTHAVAVHDIFYKTYEPFKLEVDSDFKVPYPTADITLAQAGSAINIIPDKAVLKYSGRFFNVDQKSRFTQALSKNIEAYANTVNGLTITHEIEVDELPAFTLSPDHPFVQSLLKVADFSKERKVAYGTEAGYFANKNIPTVVLGPGDIAQAHTVDEFLEASELSKFEKTLLTFFQN